MSDKEFEEKYNALVLKVQKAWDKEDIVQKAMNEMEDSCDDAKGLEDQVGLIAATFLNLSMSYSEDLVEAALHEFLLNDSHASDGSKS